MSGLLRITFTESDKAVARELLADCPLPRDRLPYTTEFDDLHERFRIRTGKTLANSVFWRLLSSAAKVGGLSKRRR